MPAAIWFPILEGPLVSGCAAIGHSAYVASIKEKAVKNLAARESNFSMTFDGVS